ncbi:twin-arginine translocation signal domain-containing protein [Xanthobacter autotrophicus]|uniref:twin-arginine translocation signal domain-containing protein n=1 Tax=Xanthobacter autotrophicus TaxID=280 RepID=UPI0024A6F058|nr:twin-arginine translocation signal domain-containing protein [Xanthobacter autotrophicus]MDI4657237.1 twin-arginine translocation signal domain-containing protein [Xanthobacter autotrophicus]
MPRPTAAANAALMPEPTRRSLLKASGALGTVAALAVPVAILPKAEAAEHPDAELLRLGAEFEREHVILVHLKKEEKRCKSVFEVERARRGTQGWDDLTALHEETGYEAAIDRSSDQFDKLDAITSVIRSIPAQTIAGLAVKVRATAYDCHFSLSFDLPPDQIDWQEGCFLQLVRDVERMAKVAAHV